MGFILSLIAFQFMLVAIPLGVVYGWIVNANQSNKKYVQIAIQRDIAINVACSELLNDIFIKQRIHEFGSPYETISYVLGKNKEINNLTKFGGLVTFGLHYIDPFHVEKAIDKDVPIIKLQLSVQIFRFIMALFIAFIIMLLIASTFIGLFLTINWIIKLI